MENFRTVIEIFESRNKLSYHSKAMFIGSCFAESIGNILQELKFPIDINPFGIIYNPISVKNSIDFLITKKTFTEEDICFDGERWFSFYHHSRFSNISKEMCLQEINERINISSEFLKKAEFLFITFGSAWVYELMEKKQIVSNCHKFSNKEFDRYLLSPTTIVDEYKDLINRLQAFNPKLKIIFTVSPIRHLKDGATGNQVSKSTLILAIHELDALFQNVFYFPSYEIMMDDLRDYRFYNEDMTHPNSVAIKYIWDLFTETYIEKFSQQLMTEIDAILKAKSHRPFNEQSQTYQHFLKNQLGKIYALKNKHRYIDLTEEELFFKSKQALK